MADNINTNSLNVSGNAVIGHDLTVQGNLVTDNVIGPDKGMFQSRYELVTSYPHPQDGWYAIVGTSLNGDVYTAKDGQWQPTGEKGAVLELSDDQVNDLAQRLNKSNYDAAEHLGHFDTEAELMDALNNPGLWNGSSFHSILTYTVNKGDGSQKDGGVVLQSRGSGNQMTQYWFSDNGAIKVRTAANYTRYTYTPSVPCDIPWSAFTLSSLNALSDADKAKLSALPTAQELYATFAAQNTASSEFDGLMSASDKTKLDALPTAAQLAVMTTNENGLKARHLGSFDNQSLLKEALSDPYLFNSSKFYSILTYTLPHNGVELGGVALQNKTEDGHIHQYLFDAYGQLKHRAVKNWHSIVAGQDNSSHFGAWESLSLSDVATKTYTNSTFLKKGESSGFMTNAEARSLFATKQDIEIAKYDTAFFGRIASKYDKWPTCEPMGILDVRPDELVFFPSSGELYVERNGKWFNTFSGSDAYGLLRLGSDVYTSWEQHSVYRPIEERGIAPYEGKKYTCLEDGTEYVYHPQGASSNPGYLEAVGEYYNVAAIGKGLFVDAPVRHDFDDALFDSSIFPTNDPPQSITTSLEYIDETPCPVMPDLHDPNLLRYEVVYNRELKRFYLFTWIRFYAPDDGWVMDTLVCLMPQGMAEHYGRWTTQGVVPVEGKTYWIHGAGSDGEIGYFKWDGRMMVSLNASSYGSGKGGLMSGADKRKLDGYAATFDANPTATTDQDGLMSKEDKLKLNRINYQSGQSGNQTTFVYSQGNAIDGFTVLSSGTI